MTRNQPGPPPEGYPYDNGYGSEMQPQSYDQPQYPGENVSSDSNRGYSEYGAYPPPNPPHYSEEFPSYGSAQSYAAPNDRPYQPYLGDNAVPVPRYSPAGTENTSHRTPYGAEYLPYAPESSTEPPVYGRLSPSASPVPSNESEARGLKGALAGGAAGAYGGHKVHHGFLGTLGGAIAGSMLEDQYKKHEKEKHQRKEAAAAAAAYSQYSQRPQQQPQQTYPVQGPSSVLAGNFAASSRGMRLEGTKLIAEAKDCHGRERRGEIDLNDCLTNTWGKIEWRRNGNFGASVRQIRLVDNGSVLEAEADNGNGGWVHNRVWLNEKITNDDGQLKMLE